MPEVSRPVDGISLAGQPGSDPRVSPGFVALYALAYISTSLLSLAPLLVTLALKVNSFGRNGAGSQQSVARGRGRCSAGRSASSSRRWPVRSVR